MRVELEEVEMVTRCGSQSVGGHVRLTRALKGTLPELKRTGRTFVVESAESDVEQLVDQVALLRGRTLIADERLTKLEADAAFAKQFGTTPADEFKAHVAMNEKAGLEPRQAFQKAARDNPVLYRQLTRGASRG